MGRNLYQYEDFFELTVAGITYDVDEPVDWDKVSIKGERDPIFMGFNYEFIDPATTLSFPDKEGGEYLRAEYELKKGDAAAQLVYGYNDPAQARIILYVGNLNFNDFHEIDEGVSCTVEKTVFEAKLRTRIDVKVTLSADKNQDNGAITPLEPVAIKMHSRKIKKFGQAFQMPKDAPVTTEWYDQGGASGNRTWWLQPDTQIIDKAEVEEIQGQPPLTFPDHAPWDYSRFQFVAKEEGEIYVRYKKDYTFQIKPNGRFSVNGNLRRWQLVPFIRIYDKDGNMKSHMDFNTAKLSGDAQATSLSVKHSFDVTTLADLKVGDMVYLNVWFNYSGTSTGVQNTPRMSRMVDLTNTLEFNQQTVAPTSIARWYRIYDVLNYLVESLTGRAGAVHSVYFGPGGCGYKRAITNGYQVRNFEIATRPVVWSLKAALDFLRAEWCVGVQYTLNAAGQDILIIEPAPALFGNGRIIDFPSAYDYGDDHAKKLTFNEVEIGYDKWAEDEANTLDEFNTIGNWLLPITTYKDKYIQKTGVIAAGSLIEKVRREQFKEAPSTSLSEDDNIFVLCYLDMMERVYSNVTYTVSPGPSPGTSLLTFFIKDIDLIAGDKIQLIAVSIATILVLRPVPFIKNQYEVASPLTASGVSDVRVMETTPISERNENYLSVTGLISPESAYNLALSPMNMLFWHAYFLNTCLYAKSGGDIIKCNWYKNNGEVTMRFDPSRPCKPFPDDRAAKVGQDWVKSDLAFKGHPAQPTFANFKTECSWDDLLLIKAAMLGLTGTDADYGTISHPDLHGNFWESRIWTFEYSPAAETLTISALKLRKL